MVPLGRPSFFPDFPPQCHLNHIGATVRSPLHVPAWWSLAFWLSAGWLGFLFLCEFPNFAHFATLAAAPALGIELGDPVAGLS